MPDQPLELQLNEVCWRTGVGTIRESMKLKRLGIHMATNGRKDTACTSPPCGLLKLCCRSRMDSGFVLVSHAFSSARWFSTVRGWYRQIDHTEFYFSQLITDRLGTEILRSREEYRR